MTWCSKCQSYDIDGPVYVKNEWSERLKYTCKKCGYEYYGFCADEQARTVGNRLVGQTVTATPHPYPSITTVGGSSGGSF